MAEQIDYSAKQELLKMDEQEQRGFLLETAKKVSTWISDEVVMKRFQEQAKAFYDDYQEWYRENDQYLKEIGVRDKETKKAREKRISKISPPRPCPLDLLTIPDHHTNPHILHLAESIFPKRHEQKFSPEKIMKADYVFLTVLHDKALKDTRHFNPINTDIWPQDEEWAEHLWQRMMEERSGWKPEFLLNELNDALDKVETDLAKKPAEIQQSQRTEIPSEIKLLEQIAEKLRKWADQNKKLIRKFSASLTGPLPPMDYERVVVYLQGNNPNMAGIVQGHYEELISCAKEIDTRTADGSRSALETATSLVGELGFLANRLAQTLEVTAQNLTLKKPAETKQKEIVEVKPGLFGITVNIKEIARRIWKRVCSRSKD